MWFGGGKYIYECIIWVYRYTWMPQWLDRKYLSTRSYGFHRVNVSFQLIYCIHLGTIYNFRFAVVRNFCLYVNVK